MFVFEVEVGEGYIADIVELEGGVGSLDHAELARGFGDVKFAIDVQANVVEVDVVDGADAVAPQHGGVSHVAIDILDDDVVDGFRAGCLLHELVVQTQESQLLHIDVEVAERDVVDFHAFAEVAVL